jgi:hypothetical protein
VAAGSRWRQAGCTCSAPALELRLPPTGWQADTSQAPAAAAVPQPATTQLAWRLLRGASTKLPARTKSRGGGVPGASGSQVWEAGTVAAADAEQAASQVCVCPVECV